METILKAHFQETLRQPGGQSSPVIELRKKVNYLVFPGMKLKRDLIDDLIYSVELTEAGYLAEVKNIMYGEGGRRSIDQFISEGWKIHER